MLRNLILLTFRHLRHLSEFGLPSSFMPSNTIIVTWSRNLFPPSNFLSDASEFNLLLFRHLRPLSEFGLPPSFVSSNTIILTCSSNLLSVKQLSFGCFGI